MIRRADLDKTLRGAGPGPGHMVPQQQAQQTAAAQQQEMQLRQQHAQREAQKRIARKPTERNLPDGIDELVIGDAPAQYRQLREIEQRYDAVMTRKRLEMQENITRYMNRHRTMRIWISNTAENQPWQQGGMDPDAFDFASDTQATYRVRIEGRLLDDEAPLGLGDDDKENEKDKDGKNGDAEADKDPDAMEQDGQDGNAAAAAAAKAKKQQQQQQPVGPQRSRLSHFFKSITIDFDRSRSLQPDGFTQIEWKKPLTPPGGVPSVSADANFDSLEFERKGDENINVVVRLARDEHPERYRLSRPMAELLDVEEEDRAGVMMGVWDYIRAQRLNEDEDARKVVCDERLKAVGSPRTL